MSDTRFISIIAAAISAILFIFIITMARPSSSEVWAYLGGFGGAIVGFIITLAAIHFNDEIANARKLKQEFDRGRVAAVIFESEIRAVCAGFVPWMNALIDLEADENGEIRFDEADLPHSLEKFSETCTG